ncbi:unnamed protein product [Symbiodinium sp. CCMP2592]|nr:unnamed protein product [Symbiodinium sp. CCMP2592]
MSSVILDSEASFRERCSKIGLSNDLLGKLIEAGYNTFEKLAFAASSTPQGLTDEAVDSWLATVVTPAPGSFQVSVIRRLLFESQSLNVADLKSRVEGTPEGSVRRLPQAERKERIEAQHRRLSGLILTSHTTPAHSCIDLVTDMYENNTLKYIPINRWISRFQEMSLQKKDSAVQMDNEGNLKVIQKKPQPTCDTTGMYPLRQAFQRRSLAFDLGHLCSFEAMETWINKLFEAVQRTVPKGYVAVSLGQVVTADRELFVRLADMLEGQLQKPIGVEKPMDAALRDLSGSQEINQFLQPLVAPPPAPHPTKRPFKELTTPTKGDGKGKTPNKGGEKGGGKASRVTIPDGCEQPPVKSDSWVYELFAGSARFSKAIFWDLIKECPPFHVHASPPAGLPSLSAASQQSLAVRKDNVLYRFVYKLLLHCSASGINVSVENPRNSLFWKVLQCFAEAEGLLWPPAALEYVDFDQCCHGSDRPKSTRFLCTRGLFHSLRATCPGNHVHRPWGLGLVFHERSMQLSSSMVSAYPVLLCKRMASCLESAASFLGLSLQASPDLAASSVAVLGRQHRRFPPLIPEFRKVSWEPPSFQPDDSCRILLSQIAGEDGGRENAAEDSNAADNADEARLHSSFDPWFEKVVAGKRLLLWKHLLEQNGFDDMQVCDFMMSGVPIVGQSACPPLFSKKIVPATMSEQDLKSTASFRRRVLTGSSGMQAADLQDLLSKATMDEVDLGFLEGPYTESQVSGLFHSEDWNCIRRFLILQGAENKPRPIDDGHEALINNCFTATIKLELQSSDFVAALATRIAIEEAQRSRATGEPPRSWLGKCLDLSKAYKQMPMKKEHRSLAVIYHKGPAGEDQFFIANSLLFGLTASVYGFVRTSRSLHKLLLKIFKLPS